jgi:hypothetical protein
MSEGDVRKVCYLEGDRVRVLVGEVHKSEDTRFLVVERPGGAISINVHYIVFIAPTRWADDREADR